MASEVFSIDIDLSKLQEALKITEDIKNNLSGIGKDKKNSIIDNFKKSNKELKNQNALLKTSLKTLQLIRLTAKSLFAGALGLGALGLSGYANATKNNRKYKTIGINERQGYSLDFASEMLGFDKETLTNTLSQLQASLKDINKAGDFSILGLNRKELQKMNPIEALQEYMKAAGNHRYFGTDSEFLLRDTFNNIAGDFNELRTVLGDNTKEMQKYFKEGMQIYKDNYGNLKEGDQALIRLKAEFNRIRLMLATKFEPLITAVIKKIKPLLEKGADSVGKAVDKAVNWFFEINKETGKTNLDQLFINLKNIADNFATIWTKLKPILTPLGEALVGFAKGLLNNPLFQWFIRTDEQKKAEKDLRKNLGLTMFSGGIKDDNKTFETLQLTKRAYENNEIDFSQMQGIIQSLKDNITASYNAGGYSSYDKSLKLIDELQKTKPKWEVNDAVITKNGQVIKTSPQDYIFATKQPQALATSGNYTININATVRNDNDIQKIKYELNRLIKSFNVGR